MNKKHIEKRVYSSYNGSYRRWYFRINTIFMKGGTQDHFYFFRGKGFGTFLSK